MQNSEELPPYLPQEFFETGELQHPQRLNEYNIWQKAIYKEVEKKTSLETEMTYYHKLSKDYADRVIKMENLLWRTKEVEKENKDAARVGHVEEEAQSSFHPSHHLLLDGMCGRCRNQLATVVLLPCRHLCFCADCENGSDACLICHAHKVKSIRVTQIHK